MGLQKIVTSKGYKNFMAKLYGIGAAVVIIGALFKINHYPGADWMLIAGLGTEALIFFFSAFEPPHVEPDWSLVYPELAGLYHDVDKSGVSLGKAKAADLDSLLDEANVDKNMLQRLGKGLESLSENANQLSNISQLGSASNEFTEKLKEAKQSIETLKSGYNNQADVLKDKIAASKDFAESLKMAKGNINDVSSSFKSVASDLNSQVSSSAELGKSMQSAIQSVNQLASESKKSAEMMQASSKAIDLTGNDKYKEQLEVLTKKLEGLNSAYDQQMNAASTQNSIADKLNQTIDEYHQRLSTSSDNTKNLQEKVDALAKLYEVQINYTSAQADSINKLKDTLDVFLSKLNDSADKTGQFNSKLDDLGDKVASLNNVYGNMLDAMSSRR